MSSLCLSKKFHYYSGQTHLAEKFISISKVLFKTKQHNVEIGKVQTRCQSSPPQKYQEDVNTVPPSFYKQNPTTKHDGCKKFLTFKGLNLCFKIASMGILSSCNLSLGISIKDLMRKHIIYMMACSHKKNITDKIKILQEKI